MALLAELVFILFLVTQPFCKKNYICKQAEAEVVPSSRLVKVEVDLEVEVEVGVEVEFEVGV